MDSNSPSVSTTESAKNPMGQHSTMSAAFVGTPKCGNPELNHGTPHVISPTSTIGHNSLEHGSKS